MTMYPDGRVEGTPEELAAYAQAIRRQMDAARQEDPWRRRAADTPTRVVIVHDPRMQYVPRFPAVPAAWC